MSFTPYQSHAGTVDSFDPGFFSDGGNSFLHTNQVMVLTPATNNTAMTNGIHGLPYVSEGANAYT